MFLSGVDECFTHVHLVCLNRNVVLGWIFLSCLTRSFIMLGLLLVVVVCFFFLQVKHVVWGRGKLKA